MPFGVFKSLFKRCRFKTDNTCVKRQNLFGLLDPDLGTSYHMMSIVWLGERLSNRQGRGLGRRSGVMRQTKEGNWIQRRWTRACGGGLGPDSEGLASREDSSRGWSMGIEGKAW